MKRDFIANRYALSRIMSGLVLTICIINICILPAIASADMSGTWKSTYMVGTQQRSLEAVVHQDGNFLTGYYTAILATGTKYSGIVHGVISGSDLKAYYVALKTEDEMSQPASVIFADLQVVDDKTMKGTLTVEDSTGFSGPVEAKKI
jgi:hypothetical protein